VVAAFVLFLPQVSVLAGTHSHNDYLQARPLNEALDNGFSSVEVDVFLVNGRLLVGHDRKDLQAEKTIEALYLKPLADRVKEHGGWVYPGRERLWVLVDIKADGSNVYRELKRSLSDFPSLRKAVRFVISGDRPIDDIVKDKGKFAALDGRWEDLVKGYSPELMPWVSESWTTHFQWVGLGPFPAEMQVKLSSMSAQVHSQKRLLRFWGAPDSEVVWKVQREGGVDWLNTDRPAELRRWLLR